MDQLKELPPNLPTVDMDKQPKERDIGTLVQAACMMIADNGGVQKFELVMTNGKGEPRPIAVIVMPDVKRAKDWIKDPNQIPTPVKRIKLIGTEQP